MSQLARECGMTISADGETFNHNFRTLIIDASGHLQMVFPTGGDLSDQIVTEIIKQQGDQLIGQQSGPMKSRRVLASGSGLMTLMALLMSCSTTPPTVVAPLEIPGAHYAGNRACADCHAGIVRKFPASPHARLQPPTPPWRGRAAVNPVMGRAANTLNPAGFRSSSSIPASRRNPVFNVISMSGANSACRSTIR